MAQFSNNFGSGKGITKGLYRLDGNSRDFSGNGNNGTDTNVTYPIVNGRRVASFNGTSKVSSIIDSGLNGDVTFAAWVEIASQPVDGVIYPILSSNVSSYNNYWIILDYASAAGIKRLGFEKYDGTNNPGARVTVTLSAGIWYRVVGTKIGNILSLYLNGSLLGTTTDTTASIPTYSNCSIGYAYGPGSRNFNGYIHDARVENYGWSSTMVAYDYASTKNKFGETLYAPKWKSFLTDIQQWYQAINPHPYLINSLGSLRLRSNPFTKGYWKLDGSSYDYSNNNNNGTDANITYPVVNGRQVAYFNGTNADISNFTGIYVPNTNFTYIVDFKTTVASGHKIIGAEDSYSGTGVNAYDKHLWVGTDGKLYAGVYDGSARIVTTPFTVTDGNWHTAVMTCSNNATYLYLDGKLIGSMGYVSTSSEHYLRIASYALAGWTNGANGYYSGYLRNIRFETKHWSAAEVAAYYNNSGFFTPINRIKRKLSNIIAAVSNFFYAFFNQ